MKVKSVTRIRSGQDGATWGPFLFRFQSDGSCYVYELTRLAESRSGEAEVFAQFRLDRAEELRPHSNAVCFGTAYAADGDEFPLLYTNIYNTYAREENRMEGVCCVYRLWREETVFHTELVQLIRVGFTKDPELWCSPDERDVRPYGNFTIDRARGLLYAFTMRDEGETTRYFAFRLPRVCDGEQDGQYGVPAVVLNPTDILDWFDCPYQHYVQGACTYDGRIYSLEGFTGDEVNAPALRVIDPVQRREIAAYRLGEFGLAIEPELIDFCAERCLYADHSGNLYELVF